MDNSLQKDSRLMSYERVKFQSGTIEREVYNSIFPRFQQILAPGLLQEIIEAVIKDSGFGDDEALRAEIDEANEEVVQLRQALDHLSDCLNGLMQELEDKKQTVEALRKYAKEKSEG